MINDSNSQLKEYVVFRENPYFSSWPTWTCSGYDKLYPLGLEEGK